MGRTIKISELKLWDVFKYKDDIKVVTFFDGGINPICNTLDEGRQATIYPKEDIEVELLGRMEFKEDKKKSAMDSYRDDLKGKSCP
jgi:hypothetical protein